MAWGKRIKGEAGASLEKIRAKKTLKTGSSEGQYNGARVPWRKKRGRKKEVPLGEYKGGVVLVPEVKSIVSAV